MQEPIPGLLAGSAAPEAHVCAQFSDVLGQRPRDGSIALLGEPALELTYNGRGALLRACVEIARRGGRDILLPAYHCPSGISPAIHAGLRPVFYRIGRDLQVDFHDLAAKVGANTAAVLVIHYFGIATDLRPLLGLRERGIAIIEDWSHSFLQGSPVRLSGSAASDYRVFSFWKLAPSVIGGGLWRRCAAATAPSPSPTPPLRERAVRLKRMLEKALKLSDHRRAKALFARLESLRLSRRRRAQLPESVSRHEPPRGEDNYPFDARLARCRMPGLARRMLESCDFEQLAARRRENFNVYGQLLRSSDQLQVLHPRVPEESCPWVFPVLLQQRDAIDHRWRAAGVALHTFGLHLHSALFESTDAPTIADARYLSQHLLCLAIHQNLSTTQIRGAAQTINCHLAASSVTT